MGISPEVRNPDRQSTCSLASIRGSSLFTSDVVKTILRKIEDEEKLKEMTSIETVPKEMRGFQTMPPARSPVDQLAPRRNQSAHGKVSRSKIRQDARKVLEKFLERSLSLNDATPMQKVYQDYEGELDIIEEDGPRSTSKAAVVTPRTPVVTPVKPSHDVPVGTGLLDGARQGNEDQPYALKKVLTDPVRKDSLPTPDEDVWVRQSAMLSPGSLSSKSEETLKADTTLVSDDSKQSKSSSQLSLPLFRPKSACIAQTEFSVVNDIDVELPSKHQKGKQQKIKNKQKSLDMLCETSTGSQHGSDSLGIQTVGPSTLTKADTISTASYDQYLKERSSKSKNSVKEIKKKGQKPKPVVKIAATVEKEHKVSSPVKKSMTISAPSYQNWKQEQKVNGARRGSRDSQLDSLEQTKSRSSSTSSISSDDYHEPKVSEDGKRKKKTGFKRAMERLRMSYRRKLERPSSVNSADFYAVKQKPVFKKKKKSSIWKFWKKSSSTDEVEKLKQQGLNDPKLLEDSHSDDAKKGVILKTKHQHKKKQEENAFENLLKQLRKGGSTLRRRISRKESLRSPGHKSKSLDVLDESPGSSIDLGHTTTSLPEKKYLQVDSKHSGSHRKSSSLSRSSPKKLTEEFSNIIDTSVHRQTNGHRLSEDQPPPLPPPRAPSPAGGAPPPPPHVPRQLKGGLPSPPPHVPSKSKVHASRTSAKAPPGPPLVSRQSEPHPTTSDESPPLPPRGSSKPVTSLVDNQRNDEHELTGYAQLMGEKVKSKEMRRRLKLDGLVSPQKHDLQIDGGGDSGQAGTPLSPSAIAQKPMADRTEEEKDVIYDKVAKKLAEIADSYVQQVESGQESSSDYEPTSPIVLTATGGATGSELHNPLEMKLASLLRHRGDEFANGEFPAEALKKIVTDATYNQFKTHVNNILPKSEGFQQIAVLFQLTKAAVQWVGVGAQQANRIKEMSLQYFEDKFAEWLSDQGGWDSMVEDSSDFELD